MKCQACNKNKGTLNNNMIICQKCLDPKSMKLLTKTHAQKRYALSSKDLNGIRHAIGWNNGRNVASSLYIIDDIEKIAIQKYGSIDNVIKKIKEREDIKKDIVKKKKDIIAARRKQLCRHLIDIGLSGVPDDSIICQEYINNGPKSGYDISKIGDIMLETEFFNSMTDYQKQLRLVRIELRSTFGRFVDDEDIKEEAKLRCLKKYVKDNYMNHHKMVDELPPSLREEAFRISNSYYENGVSDDEYEENGIPDSKLTQGSLIV